MSVTHHAIEVAGELVGHAISLGTRFELYTIHPRLKGIDSLRFESLAGIRAAVADGLRLRNPATPPWRPRRLNSEAEITDLLDDQIVDDDPRTIKGS